MDIVEACCLIEEQPNGFYLLKPKRNIDIATLKSFVGEKGRYVNVRVMNRAQSKTYDQTKAFWALCSILYELTFGKKPKTDMLDKYVREDLYPQYMPYEPKLSDPSILVHKTWSQLTIAEGVEVIAAMIADIGEMEGLSKTMEYNVGDLFAWLQEKKNGMYCDPTDYDEKGLPLSKEEWSQRNKLCMVTGVLGGDVCHIVSRQQGQGLEWLINQSWNFYRGVHELHLNLQHSVSWEALFNYDGHDLTNPDKIKYPLAPKIAPHLKARVERAHRLFDIGRQLDNQGYTPEEITKYLVYCDKEEDRKPIEKILCGDEILAKEALEDIF